MLGEPRRASDTPPIGITINHEPTPPASVHSEWPLFGTRLPKSEIQYFSQVLFIFLVAVTSILNLTIYKDPSSAQFWTALLSSSVGYILPNPSLKRR